MKKTALISFILAILLLLGACGNQAAPAEKYAFDSNYSSNSAMEAPAEAEAYGGGFAVAEDTLSYSGESQKPDLDPEKIIYSASATLETTEFDACIAALDELIQSCGGFVESSSMSGSNYYSAARGGRSTRSASYLLRVPSSSFSAIMGRLPSLGNVPYSHTYTENVSAQYYDVEARLTAYRAQEDRLVEMMGSAETVSDLIKLEDRLTELRYQIESLQSRLRNWDRQVSYSSISLEVQEVREYTPEPDPSYLQQLGEALKDGLRGTVEFFSDLLLVLVQLLPTLIILGILAVIFVPIIRRRRAAKKAKKQAEREEKA